MSRISDLGEAYDVGLKMLREMAEAGDSGAAHALVQMYLDESRQRIENTAREVPPYRFCAEVNGEDMPQKAWCVLPEGHIVEKNSNHYGLILTEGNEFRSYMWDYSTGNKAPVN